MNKKSMIYLIAALLVAACSSNTVKISGTLKSPAGGGYIFLDELKSNELSTIDSVKISDEGKFNFKTEIKNPAFYILKISEKNFLTMLLEPGQKINFTAHHDSLNYPESLGGSEGTEKMVEYNKTLRKTIGKFVGLNESYMQNSESPDLPAVIESL